MEDSIKLAAVEFSGRGILQKTKIILASLTSSFMIYIAVFKGRFITGTTATNDVAMANFKMYEPGNHIRVS
jgi:hypothetical protein